MRREPRPLWALLGVVVAVVLLSACSKRPPAPIATATVAFGDSLAEESMPMVEMRTWPNPMRQYFFGGTAPCDWVDDVCGAPIDDRTVVVVTVTGNSQTTCMSDGRGGFLRGDALVAKYRTDVTTLIDSARARGAWVLLVGQPARGGGDALGAAEVEGINDAFRQLAAEQYVGFVDAGATVELADGSPARMLPCAPGEPECGPDSMNEVRNADGVHLCPGKRDNPCPVYSSGAWRYAEAIADAVMRPAAYD